MAGAGYKLFNTGDVLTAAQVNTYLMEQSVMVFADAAARTTALSGVVAEGMLSYLKDTNAVEVYDGANWVASDDPNAIQNTIVDAKGDLIAASADNVPARLAAGNNGETLVADSSTTTGLRYTSGTVQDNPVINSAFQNWQRGTSISLAASAAVYTADRWYYGVGANQASTVSRQVTNDTTNLPNIQYCARVQRNSGETGTSGVGFDYTLETIDSIQFAGKTVTLSFYARKGADFSPTSSIISARLVSGTGTDQKVSTFTGLTNVIAQNTTLTATWQRFTYTATIATTATQIGVRFVQTPTGTASTNDYFEVTGVQIDIGSVALPYRTYSATLAGELEACQRYYWRFDVTAAGQSFSLGFNASSNTCTAVIPYPVSMRTLPTALEQSGTAGDYSVVTVAGVQTCSAVPAHLTATKYNASVDFTATGLLTGGQAARIRPVNANAFLGWSAEL